MIPSAANTAATAAVKIFNASEWPGQLPKSASSLRDLSHPAGGGLSHGHAQKKMVKIARVVPEIG